MILKTNVYYEIDLQVRPDELEVFKSHVERLTYKFVLEAMEDTERIVLPKMNEFISAETLKKLKQKGLHITLLAPAEIQNRLSGKPPAFDTLTMIPMDLRDDRIVIRRKK